MSEEMESGRRSDAPLIRRGEEECPAQLPAADGAVEAAGSCGAGTAAPAGILPSFQGGEGCWSRSKCE